MEQIVVYSAIAVLVFVSGTMAWEMRGGPKTDFGIVAVMVPMMLSFAVLVVSLLLMLVRTFLV